MEALSVFSGFTFATQLIGRKVIFAERQPTETVIGWKPIGSFPVSECLLSGLNSVTKQGLKQPREQFSLKWRFFNRLLKMFKQLN